MVRVAINGFGRIGRAAFKVAFEQADKIELVAINDLGDVNNLAYLLRYDSVYGRYAHPVAVASGNLVVAGRTVRILKEREPAKLPWADLTVGVVIESTGVFTKEAEARAHLKAGAARVIITAPTDSPDVPTVILGVNDAQLKDQAVISNASCTTNCVTPVVAIMDEAFGVEKALMTTVHAYTATQGLVDGPATRDLRRGRAAAINLVPSTTGAADAVTRAYPAIANRFAGVALRVPVPVVSLADFSFVLKKDTTVEAVNEALVASAQTSRWQHIVAVTTDPVVSTDFIGDPHSAIVDLNLTQVVGKNLVKVMAWYDNEWGYANRLIAEVIAMGG